MCAAAGAALGAAYEGSKWMSGRGSSIQLDTPAENLAPYPDTIIHLHELEAILTGEAVRPLVQQADRLAKVAHAMGAVSDRKVRASAVNIAHRIRHSMKVTGNRLWASAKDKPEATQRKLESNFAALDEFANRMVNNVDCINDGL